MTVAATPYCAIADLTLYGGPSTAFGNVTTDQKQTVVDAANRRVDSYMRGRYALPLVEWGVELTKAAAEIAWCDLMNVRGVNPTNDSSIQERADRAVLWLEQVQRQAAHPYVVEASSPTAPTIVAPRVISTSTVAVGSAVTSTNRGW
jgi:phage gp36-like protein